MPILVTGFEPFGGMAHNPSQALLELLPPAVGGVPVATACLPVDSARVEARLHELYARHRPRVALHLGLAANRAQISLERLAVNLLDFDIPDNAGHRAVDQPVRPGGPLALP
ncbi:MAG: pyrrolidone carboxyl peptidase, partial [Meiothermus sp.]